MPFIDPVEWAAFKVLMRRLGVWRALRVGLGVRRGVARGEPFGALPPPQTPKDADSRAQLGPAIVLYRLLVQAGHPDPRGVVGEVVHDGALAFLGHTLGPLRRADLAAMDADTRHAWLTAMGDRFPNATVTWARTGPEQVHFRVTACRFVSLCHALGEPDLAPLFCAGDATFFGTVEPDVQLTRPHTLAEGGPDCPFTLRWKDGP